MYKDPNPTYSDWYDNVYFPYPENLGWKIKNIDFLKFWSRSKLGLGLPMEIIEIVRFGVVRYNDGPCFGPEQIQSLISFVQNISVKYIEFANAFQR